MICLLTLFIFVRYKSLNLNLLKLLKETKKQNHKECGKIKKDCIVFLTLIYIVEFVTFSAQICFAIFAFWF